MRICLTEFSSKRSRSIIINDSAARLIGLMIHGDKAVSPRMKLKVKNPYRTVDVTVYKDEDYVLCDLSISGGQARDDETGVVLYKDGFIKIYFNWNFVAEKTYNVNIFNVINHHNMNNGMVWLGIAKKASGGSLCVI